MPPRAIWKDREENWPMLPKTQTGLFDIKPSESVPISQGPKSPDAQTSKHAWEEEDILNQPAPVKTELTVQEAVNEAGNAWGDAFDEIEPAELPNSVPSSPNREAAPLIGPNPVDHWYRNSQLAVDHFAGGSVETAFQVSDCFITSVDNHSYCIVKSVLSTLNL